ncbi:hypothetical protein E4U42_002194 [Claviceps africana]|uniref:Uncharacterized protein n=1 Tax=Claviceps africana TaxID=83212 RepID=A0A8K0JB11_9HYPO|nr:hypothetical protein E4U42_002194 [Claviceps africana]
MPASDGLQPPLTAAEREIRRSYGGWTNFMLSMGLKPWDTADAEEGKAIIAGLASHEQAAEQESKQNKTSR